MRLTMIVAAGKNGEIGRGGELIWRIPADLKRFKALTMGHAVIMGRKTWESLPKRPLPGRKNVVITRTPGYEASGAIVAASPLEALKLCEGQDEVFIMGGEQIYRQLIHKADRIELTEIRESCKDADAHIPWPLSASYWEVAAETPIEKTPEGIAYRYVTLDSRK